MLRQKLTQVLRKSYWKKQPFIFTVYLMNHVFQTFVRWPCTITELKELNWLFCINIWKTSEAANLAFQWNFVLNSAKHKFFHVSIVKSFWFQSWDFKHNYANSDTIRVVNDTYIQGKQYIQWSVILLIFLREID